MAKRPDIVLLPQRRWPKAALGWATERYPRQYLHYASVNSVCSVAAFSFLLPICSHARRESETPSIRGFDPVDPVILSKLFVVCRVR